MSARTEAARRAVRKVIRDARDKNKWRKIVRFRLWMPVALQILLVAALLWYTTSRFPGFVNTNNVRQILILALPLIVAAMAQNHALLVGYLDLSVGGMIGLGVVMASFLIGAEASVSEIAIGIGVDPPRRRRPRPRERRPGPGAQGPVDHRHPGHLEHPGRDLTDPAPDRPGGHQPRLRGRAHHERRTLPRGVHRHRRPGVSRRCLAPCFRVRARAAGGGLRRTVGETRRGPHQLGPGAGPAPVGRAGGGGLVLRDGPIADRQRAGRLHLRAEQHHRRRPGRRVPRGWQGHVHRWDGGGDPPRAHPHRPAVPRAVTERRTDDHRLPGPDRDRAVPARRHQGARQEELQASPAFGGRQPPTEGRQPPRLLSRRHRLRRGAVREGR